MTQDTIRIGPYAVTINMTDEEAAASCGEYAIDAINAGMSLNEVYRAARQAFRYAMNVRYER
jgi:hypothetical protein